MEQAKSALELLPQISPDFAVGEPEPDFDRSATLLNVAGSPAGGYLLSYSVKGHSRPPVGSGILRQPDEVASELVFVHWNALSGAPTILARRPVRYLKALRAIDVGGAWLVAYDDSSETGSGFRHYAMTLASDGTLGPSTDLSASGRGLAGFARGGNTALLTDAGGTALLLDLTGGVLASLTIATPSSFSKPSSTDYTMGGQVAFNGIDYLVTYGFVTTSLTSQMPALGFPISTTGAIAPPLVIANSPLTGWGNRAVPVGVAANGRAFLTLLRQEHGNSFDHSYRIATEAMDHTFTFGSERYLGGAPIAHAPEANDRGATALALNGHFTIARLPSTGNLQLLQPSTDPAVPDEVQPLPNGFPIIPFELRFDPVVAVDDQDGEATHLLLAGHAGAQRFDQALHAVDAAPVTVFATLSDQFMPSFAFDGQRFLAVWTDGVSNALAYPDVDDRIFAQQLSANGAMLDPANIALGSALAGDSNPVLIGNASGFTALFDNGLGRGVTLTAAVPPVITPFTVPPNFSTQAGIGTDGVHSIVAWFYGQLAISEIPSTGTWANPVSLELPPDTFTSPAIAFGANQYVVAWTGPGNSDERVIYGARLSANLTAIDREPKELLRFMSSTFPARPYPVMDTGVELIRSGDHFLLAWASVTEGAEVLRVARLSNTLALLDPGGVLVATQPFPPFAFTRHRVALGWDGSDHWVVWSDGEGGTRRPFASLRGRRFSDTLDPLDASSFLISNDLDELSEVTLAVGSEARCLVGYTRYLPSDYSYRVRARFLSSAPFVEGSPCNDAGQCQSGSCLASRCSSSSGNGGAGGGTAGNPNTGAVSGSGGAGFGVAGAGPSSGGSVGGEIAGANCSSGTSMGGAIAGADSGNGGSSGSAIAGADSGNGGTSGSAQTGDAGVGPTGEAGDAEAGSAGSNVGGSTGGKSGAPVAGASQAGSVGASAGRSGGGRAGYSCSVSSAGSDPWRESLWSFAGMIATLSCLGRRRNRAVLSCLRAKSPTRGRRTNCSTADGRPTA